MHAAYSEGTYGMHNESNTTWNPSIGMRYRFTENLSGTIDYRYTWYQADSNNLRGDYDRHVITTGLSYTF